MAKRKYFMVVDTETCKFDLEGDVCGTNSLVYDLGIAIVDRNGKIYHTENLIIDEIFHGEYLRMRNCYYANKLPQYYTEIGAGIRKVVSMRKAKEITDNLLKKYECDTIVAYNIMFDYYALNKTFSYIENEWKFFDKEKLVFIDALKMARQYLKDNKRYIKFCYDNKFLTQKGYISMTAENVYRYLIKDTTFIEKHTGLEDVLIETQIFAWLYSKVKHEMRTMEFKY